MSFRPHSMSNINVGICRVCAFIICIILAPIHAAHEPEEVSPDTRDTGLSEPRLSVPEYRSPLSAYQPYDEADFPGWREANDRVGEIGGWRVYAREAFESDDNSEDEDEKEKDSQ